METPLRPIVIIESPYGGDIRKNTLYAQCAMRDAILRGEAPYASHLLYPQPNILQEERLDERQLGITCGYAFWPGAACIAFYIDLGISPGMHKALERVNRLKVNFELRNLKGQALVTFVKAADAYGEKQ